MINDDEAHEQLMQIWMVATVGPAAIAVAVVYLRVHVTAWATEHGVLVPSAAKPLLTLPGTGGAGLDLPRVVALAAVAALVLVATGVFTRRHFVRRRRVE